MWESTGWISSGTGDLEGATGTVEFSADPASPDLAAGTGSYSFDITVPPAQSLVSVTVGGQYFDGRLWVLDDGNQVALATTSFRGTIEGIGEGTLTTRETWTKTGPVYDPTTAVITGGSGDFEGISGTLTWFPGTSPMERRYEMTVTAPVADS